MRERMRAFQSKCATIRDDGPQLGIWLWGAAMIVFWIGLAMWWRFH
jgi:hypothetical protein